MMYAILNYSFKLLLFAVFSPSCMTYLHEMHFSISRASNAKSLLCFYLIDGRDASLCVRVTNQSYIHSIDIERLIAW